MCPSVSRTEGKLEQIGCENCSLDRARAAPRTRRSAQALYSYSSSISVGFMIDSFAQDAKGAPTGPGALRNIHSCALAQRAIGMAFRPLTATGAWYDSASVGKA